MFVSHRTVGWTAFPGQVLTSLQRQDVADEGDLQIVLRSRIITGLFGRGSRIGEQGADNSLQTSCNL